MERILSDYYSKGKQRIWGKDPNTDYNQMVVAVNHMYGWLYEKGILKKESFIFKDFEGETCFAVDVKDLEKYRKEMEDSGVSGALLAARYIFDKPCRPCMYSGVIQLTHFMGAYRDNGGCVGRSWECDIVQELETRAVHDIFRIKEEKGIKEAVKAMYGKLEWNPEIKKEKHIGVLFTVDTEKIRTYSESNDVKDGISNELSWVKESGFSLKDWCLEGDEKDFCKVAAVFGVDEEMVLKVSERDNLLDAVSCELGWLEESGFSVEHLKEWGEKKVSKEELEKFLKEERKKGLDMENVSLDEKIQNGIKRSNMIEQGKMIPREGRDL